MKDELPYREDISPLCPIHICRMASIQDDRPVFACGMKGCHVVWTRWDGYFSADGQQREALALFLKCAYIAEHGYFYLGSVDAAKQQTWRCSVKDCENIAVD